MRQASRAGDSQCATPWYAGPESARLDAVLFGVRVDGGPLCVSVAFWRERRGRALVRARVRDVRRHRSSEPLRTGPAF